MTKNLFRMMMLLALTGVVLTGAVHLYAQDAEAAADSDDAAKRQRVRLKDDREIEGMVTRTEAGDYRIETKFGVLTFAEEDVVEVVDVVSPKDAYLERKGKIEGKDADALVNLAGWVVSEHGGDRGMLLNARADLKQALKIDPDHKSAPLLLRVVEGKIEAMTGDGEEGGTAGGADHGLSQKELVTQQDIYNIRLMEFDPKKDRVRIRYEDDVLKRFIDTMRASERDGWDRKSREQNFRRASKRSQVAYMMAEMPNNWELLQDIHLLNDPKFMTEFRTRIWPILRRTAASAKNGYGANLMDGYKFKVSSANTEKVDYTNFVILVGYKKGGARMVDRQNPERSLILKAGLQETIDPKVNPKSVTPSYEMMKSTEYKIVLNWIKSLKGPVEPNYHLEWQPPEGVTIDCDGKPDIPGL